jgi:hypothetical protein
MYYSTYYYNNGNTTITITITTTTTLAAPYKVCEECIFTCSTTGRSTKPPQVDPVCGYHPGWVVTV